jgi:hypothetical protein
MDPLSIASGVAQLIPFCIEAVQLIKNAIETLKNAKPILIKLLHEAERMRLLLDQVHSLTIQLHSRSTMLLPFNDSACKKTITKLRTLVLEIAKQKSTLNLQVLLQKPKANHLIQKLRRHEQEIVVLLLSVAT